MTKASYFALLLMPLIYAVGAEGGAFNCSQPPNFLNFDVNTCCRVPELNLGSATENCNAYIQSLQKSMPTTPTTGGDFPAYAHVCYPECIYHETGSLVDGSIRMENVRTFLQNNVNRRDRDIVPHILRSFETCRNNIEGHMRAVNIKMYPKLEEGCSPYASMVYGCVNAETFLHCPAKMWRDEHNCNLAKSFAAQCNPLPHVPLPII